MQITFTSHTHSLVRCHGADLLSDRDRLDWRWQPPRARGTGKVPIHSSQLQRALIAAYQIAQHNNIHTIVWLPNHNYRSVDVITLFTVIVSCDIMLPVRQGDDRDFAVAPVQSKGGFTIHANASLCGGLSRGFTHARIDLILRQPCDHVA